MTSERNAACVLYGTKWTCFSWPITTQVLAHCLLKLGFIPIFQAIVKVTRLYWVTKPHNFFAEFTWKKGKVRSFFLTNKRWLPWHQLKTNNSSSKITFKETSYQTWETVFHPVMNTSNFIKKCSRPNLFSLLDTWLKRLSCLWLAWEKSRHFATPPLATPRNDVSETSAEIQCWWRDTTQIWVVHLID